MSVSVQTVFCDDIRREENGKFILIGAYAQEIMLGMLPVRIPMSVWLRLSGVEPGTHQFEYKILLPNGSAIVFTNEFNTAENMDFASLTFGGMTMDLSAEGLITTTLQIDGGEVMELEKFYVRLAT